MIIGIVADSHDNVPMLERAVGHFNAARCELVLHAGDLVAPFSMAVMGKLDCPFKAVYGNNDGEKVGLKMKAVSSGGDIVKPPLLIHAGSLRILLTHDCPDRQAAAAKHEADLVVFGHTHDVLVETPGGKDKPPVGINPGECGGWLRGSCTAAILDTDTLEVRIIELIA